MKIAIKNWIQILTATASVFTSSVRADEVLEPAAPPADSVPVAPTEPEAPARKQVGEASTDAMTTANKGESTKYILAAGAIAIGVAALILVSHHNNRHHR